MNKKIFFFFFFIFFVIVSIFVVVLTLVFQPMHKYALASTIILSQDLKVYQKIMENHSLKEICWEILFKFVASGEF